MAIPTWNGGPRFLYVGSRPIGDWRSPRAASADGLRCIARVTALRPRP